jgi:hypothetical protein
VVEQSPVGLDRDVMDPLGFLVPADGIDPPVLSPSTAEKTDHRGALTEGA